MSKTILADVDGWTPLVDELVQKYGVITASVFGRVWRYCQMPDGVCNASQETIANELHITRKTVNEHISLLVKEGYLKDVTPDLKNKPHTYADTGKVAMKATISTVTESYSECNGKLQPTVTESYSKKQDKRVNTPRKKSADNPEGENHSLYPIAKALADVTGMDLEKNKGQIFKEAKTYKPDDLHQLVRDYSAGCGWYLYDWRGVKGQRPTLKQIRETWGNLKPANGSAAQASTQTPAVKQEGDRSIRL